MKAPFLGHVVDGVCTHKDMDSPCGCVVCTYCDLVMIECANRKAILPCVTPVFTETIEMMLDMLAKDEGWGPSPRENQAQFRGRIEDELNRIMELEARMLESGEDIVLIYPHGRYVRHTL